MLFITKAKPQDKDTVLKFLKDEGFPTVDIDKFLPTFMIAELDGEKIGTAGIEIYGNNGLMRSIIIAKEYRGQLLGNTLVKSVLNMADLRGVKKVYALAKNEQQERFLSQFGFQRTCDKDIEESCRPSQLLVESTNDQPMALSLAGYFTSHQCQGCDKCSG